MTRRIVYLTGTRADFGLMEATLRQTAATPGVQVQVIATGMHLSAVHGRTIDEVRASGLDVLAEIPLDMDTRTGSSMSLGIAECLRGVTEVLDRERPDALLLLGDRGEMLAGAIAALHVGIPCVHVHGGERSGTVDEPVRHAISKLASYHFVATEDARRRLERMGEDESRIFVTGAPGLDGLRELGDLPRAEALAEIGMPPGSQFVLAVFHPVVQQAREAARQTRELADGLKQVGLPVLWLEPNADAGSREILQALDGIELPAGSRRVTHLGRRHFAVAMNHCAAMIGNSSAGIIEAATFGTPVVNVGARQQLREHGPNVMDANDGSHTLAAALRAQLGHGKWPCENSWGDGRSAARIANLLATLPLHPRLLEKTNTY
ncbi:UDP-N-acetylglucosamine 2-epimerase [Ramlibacter albus]|uniref:UDP-N-acetylglucosamine 2-epimerase (Hydrolyzing) n=1 Tax=Ramlibacter albus TaxID=2079448 RepID=A0A923S5B4_9BURK|nr:UDP-N-acetylglucosamine 2-epimerase (hydrolyzing) [Ramlibacter albus]